MLRIPIIIEQGSKNYSAYVPDLPGCVTTGRSIEEIKANMQEAIRMHLEGMLEDGEPLPTSYSLAEYMDVPSPTSAA
jgi:predicted RNase H-like HicB family nuclease